jgi:DnaJ-class molecular chaperone
MLGLDADRAASVTEKDVKRAFREAALRWHPDRQKVHD